MSNEKLVGYVITDSNVSPCRSKVSYGASDQCQLWEVYKTKDNYGETDLEFYCVKTNIDESQYKNEYNGLPLLRSWECNVYREL